MKSRTLVSAVWIGALALSLTAFAADGDLDPSFDGDGRVVTDIGGTSERLLDLALQPDGSIVTAGFASPAGGGPLDFAVARHDSTGTPDATFAGDGTVVTDLGGSDNGEGVAV